MLDQDQDMTSNRKRERDCQDDQEFMPLSKRINNLHINTNMQIENSIEWGPGPPLQNHPFPDSPPNSEGSVDWNQRPHYAPNLAENQNPHYFNINKLLYEMYVERLNRGCHQV